MKKILILVIALMAFNPARAGQDGGGGTTLAAEFVFIGRNALIALAGEFPDLDLSKAEEILKNTEVFGVQHLCYADPLTGETSCLDARYLPIQNKIEFDTRVWRKKSCNEKFVITAHEYLRAGGLEDANYYYSSQLFVPKDLRSKQKVQDVCNMLTYLADKRRDSAP
jgi:hypothetical protein